MEITIEKNKAPKKNPKWVDILRKLEVGESFLVPDSKRNNVACIVTQWFHNGGKKRFRSTAKDQPDGMVRFWRED